MNAKTNFLAALFLVTLLSAPAVVMAAPGTPEYQVTYYDAVTGDNQFKNGSTHYWFVNPGADNYSMDVYERPTAQTYKTVTATSLVGSDPLLAVGQTYVATGSSSPAYFGYLDVVSGQAGHKNGFLYFAIELYSVNKVGNNGVVTADFGESTYYNVRFSSNANGSGGMLLSAENPKDLTSTFSAVKQFGYWDRDGSVGGAGGLATTYETTGHNGYETMVIADGKAKDANQSPQVLWARRITNADGRPVVEFAFDYATFNSLHFSPTDIPLIVPELIGFIEFEATRGLKGQSNYLWNDKYSELQAGTPYTTAGLGNIYELDTLRGTSVVVIPEPTTMALLALGGGLMLLRRRK